MQSGINGGSMRSLVKILAVAGIFTGAFFFSASNGVAKPEY